MIKPLTARLPYPIVTTMHTYVRLLICTAWFASASLPALAQTQALQPFTARYQASYMGMQGKGTVTLEATDDGHWRYTLIIRNPFARVRQSTVFTHADDVLRPLHSVSDTRVFIQRRVIEGHYDWDARQATWTGDARPHRRGPVALEPGDMDGLLINLAVIRDLAQGRPLHYRMVDAGRAITLDYQITGTDDLMINGTPVQATRIERTNHNRQQIAWVAPGLPAPLRLLQREDSKDTLELTLLP